jgi:hypothetical protein
MAEPMAAPDAADCDNRRSRLPAWPGRFDIEIDCIATL